MRTFHSHGTFIFVFCLFYPFLSLAIDTLTPTQPLTINQTLVSNGEFFELGFFSTSNGHLYIGIWYKQIQQKTYVWVANRDAPLTSSSGKLIIDNNGNMMLVDQAETAVWASNQSIPVVNTVAQLLDNGNFVLRRENDENPENYLWQSFDYPTDTLLPKMKLGWDRKSGINRFLRSWKTRNDPATGEYSFKLNISGFPEIFLLNYETKIWRTGPWNGIRFSGLPAMKGVNIMKFYFHDDSDEIYYSFEMLSSSVYSRVTMNSSGIIQRFVWVETAKSWNEYWSFPGDLCDHFRECGPFGVCDANTAQICNCMTGFEPKNKQAWDLRYGSDGCVRSSKLDCDSDGFQPLKSMKLPESFKAFIDPAMSLTGCGELCKRNCSCAAYGSMNITDGGSGCVIWEGDLTDMRQYADSESAGQDLYVRVAASDLVADRPPSTRSSKSGSGKVVGITVGASAVLIFLLILVYLKMKKLQSLEKSRNGKGPKERAEDFLSNDGVILPYSKRDFYGETKTDELELPLFDFTILAIATNNFSNANKLGQGGFGCVYKGTLTEGEVVAVKRLSRVSDQGIEELKNEVRLIAKLQHRNLVRVLGCCIEVEEKLLIYEFMENKSLNMFLFEKEKHILTWQMRVNIIHGIARGILYLHEDSRFKIIHRDLKASNVLLDKEMNPKISDFGMARIFGSDQTEAETKKVVGTYGYMSPEYAMDGHFSTKSDVFSFGVLVLEIVSGKKNRGSSYTSSQPNLLGQAWTLWQEDNALELLDESIMDNFSKNEVLRCIQIGLLCVQEQPEDRPNMSKVLLLLSSDIVQISQPKYPGFFIRKKDTETESSSTVTINEITESILDGR